MSLSVETQNKNPVNYRYGQDFTYDNIKFAWRRQGFANKLVVGVVDDAIGKGFNIIDVATMKPIEKNAEAKEIIDTMWEDLKKTCYYDRAYGKSLGMFFLEEGMNIPIWRAYDIRNYYATYDPFATPTMYLIINRVGGTHAVADQKEIIDDELRFAYEIIIREDETKGEGISILEAPWDTLFGLASLDENGVYYGIRYGGGIRYMKIPQKKFTDTVFMAKINKMLKGAIGANGVYSLPYATVDGVKEEFSIESEHAIQIDFTMLQNLLLTTLAALTGIPVEIWRGAMLGLRSSEKNEDRYFDYLQSIQRDYRAFFKWVVNMLNSLFKWFTEEIIIDIEWISRSSLSNDELVELTGKKVDIANKAGYKVPKDYLAKTLDIPLEDKAIDPLGINSNINKDKDAEEKESDTEEEEEEKED